MLSKVHFHLDSVWLKWNPRSSTKNQEWSFCLCLFYATCDMRPVVKLGVVSMLVLCLCGEWDRCQRCAHSPSYISIFLLFTSYLPPIYLFSVSLLFSKVWGYIWYSRALSQTSYIMTSLSSPQKLDLETTKQRLMGQFSAWKPGTPEILFAAAIVYGRLCWAWTNPHDLLAGFPMLWRMMVMCVDWTSYEPGRILNPQLPFDILLKEW